MNTLVIYESQFGNTKQVAELIGKAFEPSGPVRLAGIGGFDPAFLTGIDLLLVGGPTQAHGITPAMKLFLAKLESKPAGIPAAAFDTREIATKLRGAGFNVIAPPESFLVTLTKQPQLYEGEAERASAWATEILGGVEAGKLVTV